MGTNVSFYDTAPPPQTESLEDVIRWCALEFQAIDAMLSTRELLPKYGGLQRRADSGPAADQPLDATPQIVLPYDQVTPPLDKSSGPEGVIVDIDAGTVQFERNAEGIYIFGFFYTCTITAGSEYRLEAYLNDIATGLISIVDASNQTDMVNMTSQALIAGTDGDTIDIRGTADGPGGVPQTWIVEACQLWVAKVGGRLGGSLVP